MNVTNDKFHGIHVWTHYGQATCQFVSWTDTVIAEHGNIFLSFGTILPRLLKRCVGVIEKRYLLMLTAHEVTQ